MDCPQCGRSLRVPELDGRTRKLPAKRKPSADDSLINALSELSSLDTGHPVNESDSPQPLAERMTPAAIEKQFAVPADPIPAAEMAEVETEWPDEGFEPVYPDTPVAVGESLNELAALDSGDGHVSSELLADMRAAGSHSWLTVPSLVFAMIGTAAGVALGWWLTAEGHLPAQVAINDKSNALPEQSTFKPNAALPPATADSVFQGTVEYQDATGHLLPDTGALVLLLPQSRIDRRLFDGKLLRNANADLDRESMISAMNDAGATVVRAGDEGAYAAPTGDSGVFHLVVISRHVERPDDIPVSQDVLAVLGDWFESPNHITGQLAVQMDDVSPEGRPIDFQFIVAE